MKLNDQLAQVTYNDTQLKTILTQLQEKSSMGTFWLLIIMCSLIGSISFGVGFYLGYSTKLTVFDNTTNKTQSTQDKDKLVKTNSYNYLVYIGLYSSIYSAQQAWQNVQEYSALEEKQAISKVEFKDKTLYKVIAGSFDDSDSAQAFANLIKLKSSTDISPIVKRVLAKFNTIKPQTNPTTAITAA